MSEQDFDEMQELAVMDFDEIAAAAQETDPRKAFWLYVDGPTFATSTQDFRERVWPAVKDEPVDQEKCRDSFGPRAPELKTYQDVLQYAGLEDAALVAV